MAKSKAKRLKRFVGSTAMDVVKEPARSGQATAVSDCMDTAEVVVTDSTPASSKKSLLGTAGGGRVAKKGVQKRRALKMRKERAVLKAISRIEKQERRVTHAELKKYGKQELKKME